MAENDQAQAGTAELAGATTSDSKFAVQRIYVKDSSFEAPDSPECFRKAYNPQVDFSISNSSKIVDKEKNIYEVVLKLTANVKQDDKTMFLAEVQQAGIFEVSGIEDKEIMERLLNISSPTILFPYAREAIDALVVKGSFPALMLAPVGFEAIYNQAKKSRAEQEAKASTQPAGDSH